MTISNSRARMRRFGDPFDFADESVVIHGLVGRGAVYGIGGKKRTVGDCQASPRS